MTFLESGIESVKEPAAAFRPVSINNFSLEFASAPDKAGEAEAAARTRGHVLDALRSGAALLALLALAAPMAAEALVCRPARPTKVGILSDDDRSDGRRMARIETSMTDRNLVPRDGSGAPGDYVLAIESSRPERGGWAIAGEKKEQKSCVGDCGRTRFELRVNERPDLFDPNGRPLPWRRGLITETKVVFSEELGFEVESKYPTPVICAGSPPAL